MVLGEWRGEEGGEGLSLDEWRVRSQANSFAMKQLTTAEVQKQKKSSQKDGREVRKKASQKRVLTPSQHKKIHRIE